MGCGEDALLPVTLGSCGGGSPEPAAASGTDLAPHIALFPTPSQPFVTAGLFFNSGHPA